MNLYERVWELYPKHVEFDQHLIEIDLHESTFS